MMNAEAKYEETEDPEMEKDKPKVSRIVNMVMLNLIAHLKIGRSPHLAFPSFLGLYLPITPKICS